MALPALWAFQDARELWQGRWHRAPRSPPPWRPDWGDLPILGTDALNLVLPRIEAEPVSKSVYLGIVVLLLVGVGLLRRPRAAGPLTLVAAPLLLLALGPWPTVGGHAVGVRGPAWLAMELIPGAAHWHRAAAAAVPFLAAAAAVGAEAVGLRAWIAALIVLDGIAFSQTSWPRTAHEPGVPAGLEETFEGGVVQLPFDNGRVPFSTEPARVSNRWQAFHGHPASENYEGRDAVLLRSPLIARAQAACGVPSTLPPEQVAPAPRREVDASAERQALHAWGYRRVVLHRARARTPALARSVLESALGPPREAGADLVWQIDGS
jgi:hypothetical protein